jgi:hypothetical protein
VDKEHHMGRFRDEAILVDFGQGGHGQTILIDTQSTNALARLARVCLDLANSKAEALDLLALEGVFHSSAIQSLMMLSDPGVSQLQAIFSGAQGRSFKWTETPKRWKECADLLEALIASQLPGHQYLTEEGDNILVTVQFME